MLDADALHELEPGDWGAPGGADAARRRARRGCSARAPTGWARTGSKPQRGAERFGCVCLLKGADTIVAGPGGARSSCVTEAPGLATAGTGDVLTGILAAFLAKGLEPRLAAAAAATAHGLAARSLPQRGLIASDVVSALPAVLG